MQSFVRKETGGKEEIDGVSKVVVIAERVQKENP